MSFTNATFENYSSTPPKTDTLGPQAAPIVNIMKPENYFKIIDGTFSYCYGGVHGSAIYLITITTGTYTALPGLNFELTNVSIKNGRSTGFVMYLETAELSGEFKNLTIMDNNPVSNTTIWLSNGNTFDFTNLTMINNDGATTNDLRIVDCSTCTFTFTNTVFSKEPVDTSGTPTYDHPQAIHGDAVGQMTFKNLSITNYDLAIKGGAMELYNVILVIEDCVVTNTSAIDGGAFFGSENVHITVSNCIFTNIKASLSGGIFNVEEESMITTKN